MTYHNAIYHSGHNEGQLTENDITDATKAAGATEQLHQDYSSVLEKNNVLAQALGLTGTPGLIVMPVKGATPATITVFPGWPAPHRSRPLSRKPGTDVLPLVTNPARISPVATKFPERARLIRACPTPRPYEETSYALTVIVSDREIRMTFDLPIDIPALYRVFPDIAKYLILIITTRSILARKRNGIWVDSLCCNKPCGGVFADKNTDF
jgi:hypothetical protein